MNSDKLKDININFGNYANFKKCLISSNGNNIIFIMSCGDSYNVAVDYFIKWFLNPHYILINGKIVEWEKTKCQYDNSNAKFMKCRRILSNTAVRVYLNNGSLYDVPWDTVLMSCEKRYEHFGGLTNESKRIVNEWHKKTSNECTECTEIVFT